MPPKVLAVWMYGTHVADLREERTGRLALRYTEEAAERWGNGRPVLSISLPLEAGRKHPPSVVGPWFDGLLPEGPARDAIERAFDVRRGDAFGLLAAIGRDCAGALVVQPPGLPALPVPGPPSSEPLEASQLQDALAGMDERPLGAGGEVRVSLAGQQPKLLLCRTADGWGRPTGGAPSTHILKPQDERFRSHAANEATCVTAAAALGIGRGRIDAEVLDIGGRTVLAVSRYDRDVHADGTVDRVHQEDLCQVLGIAPEEKYWVDGRRRLTEAARALDAFAVDGRHELQQLVRAVVVNLAIGNADAHGKNYALLHAPDATVALAPMYDTSSTIQYPTVQGRDGTRPVSRRLPLPVGSASTVDDVTVEDVVAEAKDWGLSRRDALDALGSTLEALPAALEHAANEIGWTDDGDRDRFLESITRRCAALLGGSPAGADDPTLAAA